MRSLPPLLAQLRRSRPPCDRASYVRFNSKFIAHNKSIVQLSTIVFLLLRTRVIARPSQVPLLAERRFDVQKREAHMAYAVAESEKGHETRPARFQTRCHVKRLRSQNAPVQEAKDHFRRVDRRLAYIAARLMYFNR